MSKDVRNVARLCGFWLALMIYQEGRSVEITKDGVETMRESEPQTTNKTNEIIHSLANKIPESSAEWREKHEENPQGVI